ncbi:MAG TPA: hypothetical protein VGX49_10735 [Jatrophihabitans sp.]|nr:hypothetical protein [Jatrophihabitans sp.]
MQRDGGLLFGRAGGVGSVAYMAALGKTVTYDQLMHDTVLSDDAELRDALNRLTDLDRIQWIEQRYAETWGLVLKLRPPIFAVARRLALDHRLTGEEVDAIVAAICDEDANSISGMVVSADEVEAGRILARQVRLEVWPDNTVYLQKLEAPTSDIVASMVPNAEQLS